MQANHDHGISPDERTDILNSGESSGAVKLSKEILASENENQRLENETGEIIMDNETINKASIPVERMIAIGR